VANFYSVNIEIESITRVVTQMDFHIKKKKNGKSKKLFPIIEVESSLSIASLGCGCAVTWCADYTERRIVHGCHSSVNFV